MMQQFVKAAQAGDTSAWNVLYRQHEPWLYATALRICGNNPGAKDAVQDTFIQAYLKLQQLKEPSAFSGWLKTTLLRNCYRYIHPVYSHNNSISSGIENLYEDEINNKLDFYAQQTKIYNTLACLTESLQIVLLLRYFSTWQSYDKIATILCIPVGTVRSRLNQAKQKLTEYWAKSNDNNDTAYKKAAEWNDLYNTCFGNVYTSLHYREKLIRHFDKNMLVVFTSGKTAFGRNVVQQLIEEDIVYGNSFAALDVVSTSNISIVECHNINPGEYPDRCPDSTVFVLQRTGSAVTQFNLHNSR